MKLTFCGAARQVTGSMFLLQSTENYNILVDCGLSYEKTDRMEDNAIFPFNPAEIDVVLLTHAHVDHSGNLPTLIKKGFKGQILCTLPTAKLAIALLDDSASIQALKRKKSKKHIPERLYGFKEVKETAERMVTLNFYEPFKLNNNIEVTFYEAGHILGAASIKVSFTENGSTKHIGFSGDLGPDNAALVVNPKPMDGLDYLICESTYGDRLHRDKNAEEILLEHIIDTCSGKPGRLIIPAFSIGRTQAILFTLNKLFRKGLLPKVRIINDSPLAIYGTRIHEEFKDYLNDNAKAFYEEYSTLFEFKQLFTIEDEDDEDVMDDYFEAMVIVSSAGMMEGGRIQEHISANLQNSMCKVLVAGFCAPGTLGFDLLNHKGTVKIKGKIRNVFARINSTDVFSAHPDANGLISYIRKISQAGKLTGLFLVHGDHPNMENLKVLVEDKLKINAYLPEKNETVQL